MSVYCYKFQTYIFHLSLKSQLASRALRVVALAIDKKITLFNNFFYLGKVNMYLLKNLIASVVLLFRGATRGQRFLLR